MRALDFEESLAVCQCLTATCACMNLRIFCCIVVFWVRILFSEIFYQKYSQFYFWWDGVYLLKHGVSEEVVNRHDLTSPIPPIIFAYQQLRARRFFGQFSRALNNQSSFS
jgi:hypothetical protein